MADGDGAAAPPKRPSVTPQLKSANINVTRLQMYEYMKQRQWWVTAQSNMVFTMCLWAAFMAQVWLRADVFFAFNLHDSIAQHVRHIVAHPSMSRTPEQFRNELPTPCRCACRSEVKPEPTDQCDPLAEVIDFQGLLPVTDKETLMELACTDMVQPLAEFGNQVSVNMSRYSCSEWIASYGTYADPLAGPRVACSAKNFKRHFEEASRTPGFVNDTDAQFLFQQGDFHAPRWRCPATCGVCNAPVEHTTAPLQMHQLSSEEEVWYWIEHGLLPDIFARQREGAQKQVGVILQRNKIIGGLRVRQRRAQTPYDCLVPDSLQDYYIPACRSPKPADTWGQRIMYNAQGTVSDFFGQFNTSYIFEEGMSAASYDRSVDAGAEDNGWFDVFFEVENDETLAFQLAAQLRREHWLDRAARGVDIQALLLNPEANFYCLLEVTFEFNYDGRVEKNVKVRVFPITKTFAPMDYIPECIWVGLLFVLFVQEMFQIGFMCYQRQLGSYVSDFWNVVDWVSICLGGGITLYWLTIVSHTVALTNSVVQLPTAPLPAGLSIEEYRRDWVAVLDQGFGTYNVRAWYLFMLFVYATVITARFLKGCVGQEKLCMIQFAVTGSFHFVFHFQIVFGVCFINFVTGGHVLFGPQLEEWSTVAKAASTTVQMLLGTFDFDRMYETLPYSAMVWLFLFLLTMVFLLMNILTAILIDRFTTLRNILGPTDSIWRDMKDGFRDFMWRCEWRVEQFRDGAYTDVFSNPYADMIEGMAEKAKISEDMDQMSQRSVLGFRLARSQQDVRSLHGLAADNDEKEDPGLTAVTSLELRKIGCDPFTAEHLIEECDEMTTRKAPYVDAMMNRKVEQVRSMIKLLREHREKLTNFCDSIESGVQEEQSTMLQDFENLEISLHDTVAGLAELKETQADSLALPPPRLEFAGTTLRNTYPNKLVAQPPRKGTAPVPGRGGLRLAAAGESPLALGDGPGYAALMDRRSPSRQQPAHPALTDGGDAMGSPAAGGAVTFGGHLALPSHT